MFNRFSIYFCRFLDALGFTIFLPLIPFLTQQLGLSNLYIGLLLSSYGFGQFFGAPVLGGLSDKLGRKNILLACQIGSILSWILILNILIFHQQIGLYVGPLFIFARLIDGLTGANFAISSAIISEETDTVNRRQMFSTASAFFAGGFILGPALAGFVISTSFGVIGYGILGIFFTTLSLLFTLFGLKIESKHRTELKTEWNVFKILIKTQKVEWLFITTRQILLINYNVFISVASLHLITVFNLDAKYVAFYFTLMGIFRIFNNLVCIKILRKYSDDYKILSTGIYLLMLGSTALALASRIEFFIAASFILTLGNAFSYPVIQSIASGIVAKNRIGSFMGSDDAVRALSITVIPTIAVFMYGYINSFVFLGTALMCLGVKIYFESRMKLFEEFQSQSTQNSQ